MYINRMACVPTELLYTMNLIQKQESYSEKMILHVKERCSEYVIICWGYTINKFNNDVHVLDIPVTEVLLNKLLHTYEMKAAHDTKTNFKFKRSSHV